MIVTRTVDDGRDETRCRNYFVGLTGLTGLTGLIQRIKKLVSAVFKTTLVSKTTF